MEAEMEQARGRRYDSISEEVTDGEKEEVATIDGELEKLDDPPESKESQEIEASPGDANIIYLGDKAVKVDGPVGVIE